mmetsp:Transcript_31285/g.75654  ORF Transcript_31285/g.75654 Transcript_31285/m.75654 type:complete len:220 (+) Transcript_31285:5169-5828(+)
MVALSGMLTDILGHPSAASNSRTFSSHFWRPASSVVQQTDQMREYMNPPSMRLTTSPAPMPLARSSSLNSVRWELSSLVSECTSSVSFVAIGSLHSFFTRRRRGGRKYSKSFWSCAWVLESVSGSCSSHDSKSDVQRSMWGSISTMPLRETVAGEATARSSTSNCMQMVGDSLMISPETRHSFLLSSSTVFMFSIHTASTGPSNMTHFLSGPWSEAAMR